MLGVKRMPPPLSESRKPESRRKTSVCAGHAPATNRFTPGFPGQPCARWEREGPAHREGEGQRTAMPGSGGSLLANLMHFARTLRAAGLPVGPGKVLDGVAAVQAVGITDRRDFYWTLHAVFVNRADQRVLFDQAFHVFWRNPELLKKLLSLVLPEMTIDMPQQQEGAEMLRRLAEALHPNQPAREAEETELEFDAAMTFSDREQLRQMEFEKMSRDELAR